MINHDELFNELDRMRESGDLAASIRAEHRGPVYGFLAQYPGKLIRCNLDGTRDLGEWSNGMFVAKKRI